MQNKVQSKKDQDWIELAREVLQVEVEGILQVQRNLDQDFVRALHLLAACQGRVVVSGVGKSGLVGRKIAATLSSTGTPAYFLHPVEGAHGDLGMIRQGDVVLAISNSGETEELNNIIPALLSLGAQVVGLTGRPDSTLAGLCHMVMDISVPREACTLGLAPTASTTATLALGDALAVALIEIKAFDREDFQRFHPAGELGRQLSLDINSLMHRDDLPVSRLEDTLVQALQVLDKGGLGTVIILDQEHRVQGILTDGDVRRLLCRESFSLQEEVRRYMTVDPKLARLGQKGAQVLDYMEKSAIMVLPVVDEQRVLQGVIHLHDLLGKGSLKLNGLPGNSDHK
ncbi:MAG: KpsF/GutQ family sugar-phosphate isomerase [Desulfohalobiaceae bacterium]